MTATATLILGGGFGGIAAANSLRSLVPSENEIVVIDKTPNFHVGAGKTWVMLGQRTPGEISRPRRDLLHRGVRLELSSVRSIDIGRNTVTTDHQTLRWDFLVIAMGADLNLSAVPGLSEGVHTFYTIEGATRLKTALDGFPGGDLVILIPRVPFKCPPAPYEAAMLLHHALAARGLEKKTRISFYTVEGSPMATAGPEMGQYIRNELAQLGIAFYPGKKTVRIEADARRIVFEDGTEARYDLLVAIPPHEAPRVIREAGLANPSGWIPVDPLTLKVSLIEGEHGVYAVGDVTVVPLPGRYKPDMALSLPKAGVFAEAQGRVVANQIAARILGREPSETFDGKGYCFLEVGEGRAVRAEGSFFALPHPVMQKQAPSAAQLDSKLEWVSRYLKPVG